MQGPRTGFQQDLHNICFIYHGPLSLRHETLARSSQKDPARELIIFFHPGLRESAKISTAPQRERSDTHKSTEKVARGSDIKSRAALRWAIWRAQSAKRVARAISKFAPRRAESDPGLRGAKTGQPFCASMRGRNAHGHLARALLCEPVQWKNRGPDGAPWSDPGLLPSP